MPPCTPMGFLLKSSTVPIFFPIDLVWIVALRLSGFVVFDAGSSIFYGSKRQAAVDFVSLLKKEVSVQREIGFFSVNHREKTWYA